MNAQESDSSPRLLPVRHRVWRRGRDLERFLNLWRLVLVGSMTALLVVESTAHGVLEPEERLTLIVLSVVFLAAIGFQLYLAWFPWNEGLAMWVVGADVAAVTGLLVGFVVLDRAIVATNSQIVFFGYFLVVALAGIRCDARVARGVTLAVPLSYVLVVFLAVAWREVQFSLPDPAYGMFRWYIQIARLAMLAVVTGIIHLDVAMGITDLAQARHDPLTGLFNRRYLVEYLGHELPRAQRHNHHLSLLLMDLDGFKSFNDTHGHLAGDELLAQVGSILAARVRASDVLVRFGGDEFLVVLPNTPGEAARRIARDLTRALPPEVGASVGVACLGKDVSTVEELLGAADIALRRAKQAGGSAVEAH